MACYGYLIQVCSLDSDGAAGFGRGIESGYYFAQPVLRSLDYAHYLYAGIGLGHYPGSDAVVRSAGCGAHLERQMYLHLVSDFLTVPA